jgi:hypothetical protein
MLLIGAGIVLALALLGGGVGFMLMRRRPTAGVLVAGTPSTWPPTTPPTTEPPAPPPAEPPPAEPPAPEPPASGSVPIVGD